MNWSNVTVFQYQQINELYANSKDLTDLDISVKVASILTNQTENQIDSLPVKELGPCNDVMGNLHKIMACMVIPQKRGWFGWKDDKYDAGKHSDYAQDMLEAPIVSVLGSVVFFYQVFKLWIKNSRDYMVQQMMEQGVEKMKAEEVHQVLCSIMDGFTKPNWLPSLKESHLTKHLTYLS